MKADIVERLNPKFGDIIENGWASIDNPTRRGFFMCEGRRTGRMNSGRYFKVTDRAGNTWELPVTSGHKITVIPQADEISRLREEVERLKADKEDSREAFLDATRLLSAYATEAGFLTGIAPSGTDPIDMQDVRLAAGEGKLAARDVLGAVNVILRSRRRKLDDLIAAAKDKTEAAKPAALSGLARDGSTHQIPISAELDAETDEVNPLVRKKAGAT